MEKNLYNILGIKPDASQNEIDMAFYNLKVKYHPAVEKENDAKNEKEFAQIEEAYEILKDPEKRKAYDAQLNPEQTQSSAQMTTAGSTAANKAQDVLSLGKEPQSVSTAVLQKPLLIFLGLLAGWFILKTFAPDIGNGFDGNFVGQDGKTLSHFVIIKFILLLCLAFGLNFLYLRISALIELNRIKSQNSKTANTNDIITCITTEANLLKAVIITVIAFFLTILARGQLNAYIASQFGNENVPTDTAYTLYFFFLFSAIAGYIGMRLSLKKYLCPFCHTPFSFFVTDQYDDNFRTYNRMEFRSENHDGRTIRIPSMVTYRECDRHTIRKCTQCGKQREFMTIHRERM